MSKNQPQELKPARNKTCPRCSSSVARLPSNSVSPVPAYKCLSCGVKLSTGSGRVLHAIVGVLALAFAAFGVSQIIADSKNLRSIGMLVVSIIIIGYCARSVVQPVVRQVEPNADVQ